MGADAPAFALVLSTDQYDAVRLAHAVTRELGPLPWAGCCTAGVFAGAELLTQGLVVGVFSARDAAFGVGTGGPVSLDARGAGRAAIAQAIAALPPLGRERSRTILLLPDALTGNASEVVRGAAQEAGAGPLWAGGGAGDNLRFVRTAQFAHGEAFRDHVVAIVLDTRLPVGLGIRHGFSAYGPPVLVTRSAGATAVELEYERPFDVYRRTAEARGDHVDEASFASFAMTHPLGIPQADGDHVIRDPLAIEPDGSLRCVGDVPDGSLVRVMQANRSELVAAARQASADAREAVHGPTGGAIIFDCVSRAKLLGNHMRDELVALQKGMGVGVAMMGCLTFGEVGAFGAAPPQFLNKTTVVLALPV